MNAPRAEKRDFHGWLILDKDVGQTSTAAVAALKRLFRAKKVGHAGTLDPLASGVLPIAFGEATKTVSYVMDGQKAYRFKVRWGVETDTDDSEGRPVSEAAARPSPEAVRAVLPRFTGKIEQTPPRYSALKIEGERAYNLAREGEDVSLAARPVEVHRLALAEIPDADHAVFETECGKGTYVRALARDMGRALGCLGHVCALRRTRVGSFGEREAVRFAELVRAGRRRRSRRDTSSGRIGSRGGARDAGQPRRCRPARARPIGPLARPRRAFASREWCRFRPRARWWRSPKSSKGR